MASAPRGVSCQCGELLHRCAICGVKCVGGIAGFHACDEHFDIAYSLTFALRGWFS